MNKRTDSPVKKTHRLSAEAVRLIAALAERLTARDKDGRSWTETDVLEKAIRLLAREERVK